MSAALHWTKLRRTYYHILSEPAQTTSQRYPPTGGLHGVKWPHHGVKWPNVVVKRFVYRSKRVTGRKGRCRWRGSQKIYIK